MWWRKKQAEEKRKTDIALQEAQRVRAQLDRLLVQMDSAIDSLSDAVLAEQLRQRLKEVQDEHDRADAAAADADDAAEDQRGAGGDQATGGQAGRGAGGGGDPQRP